MNKYLSQILICGLLFSVIIAGCSSGSGGPSERENGNIDWDQLSSGEQGGISYIERDYSKLPDPPASFDARTNWPGLILDPIEQGHTSGCWAFSSMTVASDRMRIVDFIKGTTDPALTMSVQAPINEWTGTDWSGSAGPVLNFPNPFYVMGCRQFTGNTDMRCHTGGNSGIAFSFLQTLGVPLFSDYNSIDCSVCPAGSSVRKVSQVVRLFVSGSTLTIQERETEMMKEIANYGPIVAGIKAYPSLSHNYGDNKNKDVVYSSLDKSTDTKAGGHDISIVGWGTDPDSTPYWIVRNSWGRKWADNGYVKFLRGSNFCNIESEVWTADP